MDAYFIILVESVFKIKDKQVVFGKYSGSVNVGDKLRDLSGCEIEVAGLNLPRGKNNRDTLALLIETDKDADYHIGRYYFSDYSTAFMFCYDETDKDKPDSAIAKEYRFLVSNNAVIHLIDLDKLVNGDILEIEPAYSPVRLVYRGRVLERELYDKLYYRLVEKGYFLLSTPEQYKDALLLPEWYPKIEDITPKSVWTQNYFTEEAINDMLDSFGSKSVIVRDFVRTRKHEWLESCFIPDASDRSKALGIIRHFIEKQGADISGGLVIREYVPLLDFGENHASGMPLSEEYRIFILDGKALCSVGIKDLSKEAVYMPEWNSLIEQTKNLCCGFYTIDIAKTADNGWIIIDICDGQVSSLKYLSESRYYGAVFGIGHTEASSEF